jgi:hypothetical protein
MTETGFRGQTRKLERRRSGDERLAFASKSPGLLQPERLGAQDCSILVRPKDFWLH